VSKAFTSEETPEPVPVVRAPPRLSPGEVRYVTPEGHAALRAARDRLLEERARAAGEGDAGAAARSADLERRAALLDATLATLTVLGADEAPPGRVAFATWVTVEEADGARRTWRIVGPDEADARRGLVSVDAPVARALLGREEGDVVEVDRPGGAGTLAVVAVRRHP
jgi:transcription elongation factor GreB